MIIGNKKLEDFVFNLCEDVWIETGKGVTIQIGNEVFTYDGLTFGMGCAEDVEEITPMNDGLYDRVKGLLEGYEYLLKIHESKYYTPFTPNHEQEEVIPFTPWDKLWYSQNTDSNTYNFRSQPDGVPDKNWMDETQDQLRYNFNAHLNKKFPKEEIE